MDMDIAFSGIGYTLGEAPADNNLVAGNGVGRHVPSLKEACLSTLERYIDCKLLLDSSEERGAC